jgi:uncharacterized membrane protein (DUF106 family)
MFGFDDVFVIAACAFAYAGASTLFMNKFGNKKRVMEIQKHFNGINKELGEAMKAKDDTKIQEVSKRQQESMPMMTELMLLQMRPLVIILPVIIFIITPTLRSTFTNFIITLPTKLPVPQGLGLAFRDVFGPVGWFWICVILFGFVFMGAEKLYEKYAKKN